MEKVVTPSISEHDTSSSLASRPIPSPSEYFQHCGWFNMASPLTERRKEREKKMVFEATQRDVRMTFQ
jgi:hypothetical protein